MASFETLLEVLTGDQSPRVGGLVVTAFGILGQDPGAEISGDLLRRTLALAGAKPEATRVALHRLRKEGWIVVRKAGRTSHYSLSDRGREESAAASARIYAKRGSTAPAWFILLPRSAEFPAALRDAAVQLAPQAWVAAAALEDEDALCIPVSAEQWLPQWVRNKLLEPGLLAEAARTLKVFETVARGLAMEPHLDPHERLVLHMLVVHGWRHIILGLPPLPEAIYAGSAPIVACRSAAFDLMEKLAFPGLEQLAGAAPVSRAL